MIVKIFGFVLISVAKIIIFILIKCSFFLYTKFHYFIILIFYTLFNLIDFNMGCFTLFTQFFCWERRHKFLTVYFRFVVLWFFVNNFFCIEIHAHTLISTKDSLHKLFTENECSYQLYYQREERGNWEEIYYPVSHWEMQALENLLWICLNIL